MHPQPGIWAPVEIATPCGPRSELESEILTGMTGDWKSRAPHLCVLVTLALSASLLPAARAQFIQQGNKLVGAGAVGSASQGVSVAISTDGNTAIVGGHTDNNSTGTVWIYVRSGGVWTQQGGKLVGTGAVGNAEQGVSVALSGDGNTAIVGGHLDNGNSGAAWVYTRSDGLWSQQGTSVALSADGNTAIVGGDIDNDRVGNGRVGAAWVYTRSDGLWSQQGGKLVGTGAVGTAWQGSAVALSADGNTAIVGGLADDVGAGAAWVYARSGGVWSQQGGKLAGADAVGSAQQGFSVGLSGDGNTAIVGGWNDSTNGAFGVGAAWVYARSGGVWSQQGGKLVGIGAVGLAFQGISSALSADGNTAIVGGDFDSRGSGAVWVYTRSGGGVWSQQGGKLVGADAAGTAWQGRAVALSGDGNTAIVGGWSDNNNAGAAWVFARASGPTIAAAGVVNGASFLPGIAPGTWVTIMGANLSVTTRTWNSSDFSGSDLPTQLDGVSIQIDGKLAYVSYVSPTQLNVLTPDDTTRGSPIAVQVMTPYGNTTVVNAIEAALSPALFTFSQQGGKYVAAVRADGTYMAPLNLIPGRVTAPARPEDTILFFGTGFGPTNPETPIGRLTNPAPLVKPVTVKIGGVTANTQFAGIVSPGVYQFNVIVPNVPAGDNVVTVEIDGSLSQVDAFLAVQP